MDNVVLALLLMTLGTFLASGYYVPIRKIKAWSWETYWMAQGVVSWIILPWVFTLVALPLSAIGPVLSSAPIGAIGLATLFGALWGVGGLTWGLGMRYLGVSLGQSVSYGFCAAFGTIIPRLVAGENLFASTNGLLILGATAIALAGIAIIGYAGSLRAKGMSSKEVNQAVKEFAFKKGIIIAVFAGVMSASFNFGLEYGKPIQLAAEQFGASPLMSCNPVHIFVMGGGCLTNLLYCIYLFRKNKSFKEYGAVKGAVLGNNLFFSILGGSLWYMQFLFLGMGKSLLPADSVLLAISWSILMSLNIVFSNIWGVILKEWQGTSQRTKLVLVLGLAVLIFSVFFPTLFNA